MAVLKGLLYIMYFVCGQKPDILIHKITVASKSNLEFRNRNKFRLQSCKRPDVCLWGKPKFLQGKGGKHLLKLMKTVGTSRVREAKAGLHSPYLTNEAGLQFLSPDDIMTGTDLCVIKTCSISSQNNPESTLDFAPDDWKKLKCMESAWVWQSYRPGDLCSDMLFLFGMESICLVRTYSGKEAVLDGYQPLAKLKTSFALGWHILGLISDTLYLMLTQK